MLRRACRAARSGPFARPFSRSGGRKLLTNNGYQPSAIVFFQLDAISFLVVKEESCAWVIWRVICRDIFWVIFHFDGVGVSGRWYSAEPGREMMRRFAFDLMDSRLVAVCTGVLISSQVRYRWTGRRTF